jgi:hypothetical protein
VRRDGNSCALAEKLSIETTLRIILPQPKKVSNMSKVSPASEADSTAPKPTRDAPQEDATKDNASLKVDIEAAPLQKKSQAVLSKMQKLALAQV